MTTEHSRKNSDVSSKLTVYEKIVKEINPVMRYFFIERYREPDEWLEKRISYTRSVATSSILGFVVGLGIFFSLLKVIDTVQIFYLTKKQHK